MRSIAYFKLETKPFSTTVTPNGRYFICGGFDRTIQLWDIVNGILETSWAIDKLHHFPDCNRIQTLAVTEDSCRLFVGGALLQAWNLESHKKIRSYRVGTYWPVAMDINVLRNTLLTGSGETISAWNLSNRQRRFRIKACHRTLNFAFSTDGTKFVASDYEFDRDVDSFVIYETDTGHLVKSLEMKNSFRPFHLDCDDTDTLIGVGGREGFQILDFNSLDMVCRVNSSSDPKLHRHLERIRDIKFLPGGKTLMTAGNDGSIACWDANEGSFLNKLQCRDPIYEIHPIQKFSQVALYSREQASVELFELKKAENVIFSIV